MRNVGQWKMRDEEHLRALLKHPWTRLAVRLGFFPRSLRHWVRKAANRQEEPSKLPPSMPQIRDAGELCDYLLLQLRDLGTRQLHPTALSDGPEGAFARCLAEKLPTVPRQMMDEVFNAPATHRVLDVYLITPRLQDRFPEALLGMSDPAFPHWLKSAGRKKYAFTSQEIEWFLQETRENSAERVALSHAVRAEWQKQHPEAFTEVGAESLLRWLKVEKGIAGPSTAGFLVSAKKLQQAAAGHFFLENASSSVCKAGINFLGHFNYPSGLREAAVQTIRAARYLGYAASCRDIPGYDHSHPPERKDFLGLEIYPTTIIQLTPNPQYETALSRAGLYLQPGIRRIAVCFWELPEIPWPWLLQKSWVDEIWAPTRFVREALERGGVAGVKLVLPSVSLSPFPKLRRSDFGLPEDGFLFLFMFDLSSSLARKNPLGLIEAFRLAFPQASGAAHLAIKVSHSDGDPAGIARLRVAAREANISLLDEMMTRERSYALLDLADAYVSLHRSEGLGLSMAEAMLLGKPVIATNYSGNVDFMNAGNSLLVDSRGLVPVGESLRKEYPAEGLWADPDLQQAANHMRWVVENGEAARALGERARSEMEQLLSLPAAAQRLQAALES